MSSHQNGYFCRFLYKNNENVIISSLLFFFNYFFFVRRTPSEYKKILQEKIKHLKAEKKKKGQKNRLTWQTFYGKFHNWKKMTSWLFFDSFHISRKRKKRKKRNYSFFFYLQCPFKTLTVIALRNFHSLVALRKISFFSITFCLRLPFQSFGMVICW